MPVYLFTFHAYASWMPGHSSGYRWRDAAGNLPADPRMDYLYRGQTKHPP